MREHVLSFHGLDELIHADTMLFILGLTFFVAVIAQTRMLEGVTFFLLRRNYGAILPTVIAVTAVVAFSSGILDGVSMIGLTIRTLVIILMLAAAPKAAILQAVMICTTVTTVCGVWLAYGEPPNLIMKANLDPHLGGTFFIRYCGPIAIVAYFVVARHLRKELAGQPHRPRHDGRARCQRRRRQVSSGVAARRSADARRARRGARRASRGQGAARSSRSCSRGRRSGRALVDADLPWEMRELLLGHYVSEELAASLDRHYVLDSMGDDEGAMMAEQWVDDTLAASAQARRRAQLFGALALIPFVALLVLHGVNHDVPLFLASFAGFGVAMLGIARHSEDARAGASRGPPRIRRVLLPVSAVPVDHAADAGRVLRSDGGAHSPRRRHARAWRRSRGRSSPAPPFLSAILDNNIVADFASRALGSFDLQMLHLFAMAQIAGYALGGCWTHIGSAQSVVAYSFIQRDVDAAFTPVQWIRQMTPIILEMFALITIVIAIESWLF